MPLLSQNHQIHKLDIFENIECESKNRVRWLASDFIQFYPFCTAVSGEVGWGKSGSPTHFIGSWGTWLVGGGIIWTRVNCVLNSEVVKPAKLSWCVRCRERLKSESVSKIFVQWYIYLKTLPMLYWAILVWQPVIRDAHPMNERQVKQ